MYNLSITEQPQSHYRIRKDTDGSHGTVQGLTTVNNRRKYPTVKLTCSTTNQQPEYFVLIQLLDCNGNPFRSAYLKKKEIKCNKKEKGNDKIPNLPQCFEKMELNEGNEYIYVMVDYYIFKGDKTDMKELTKIVDRLPTTESQNGFKKPPKNKVKLGFSVYAKSAEGHDQKYKYCAGPFFSDEITDGDPVKISRVIHDKNGELHLLLNKLKKDDVITCKIDDNNGWQCEIKNENITKNSTNAIISFNCPEYKGNCKNQSVTCKIGIRLNKSEWSLTYSYDLYNIGRNIVEKRRMDSEISYEFNTNPGKQPRLEAEHIGNVHVQELDITHDFNESASKHKQPRLQGSLKKKPILIGNVIKTIEELVLIPNGIEEIEKLNNDYAKQNLPNGNTFFHETVETHEFVHISHIMEALKDPQDLFRNSFNDRYENLLHYACRLNKSMYIRPLIGFRCSVVDRDQNGRTPLHVALEYRHEGCLVEFKKIFENHQKYPHIRDELRQLFDVYNDKGETVLHTAVLNDQKDLVGAMLRFCLSENINVCEIVRLTDGNTILHLAAIERFEDMQSLIVKYVENIKDYENYSGQTAEEIHLMEE